MVIAMTVPVCCLASREWSPRGSSSASATSPPSPASTSSAPKAPWSACPAASLMVAPPGTCLGERTDGLEPRSRLGLWDVINELKTEGTPIVLTTQYLEEADHLCDTISVIDAGRIIAKGTATELKRLVGG